MVLLHFLGRQLEFINEFRPPLLSSCNIYPLFLSQVTACFNSGSCISEGDKDILFPPKAEALKGIQAVLGFPKLKIVKPNDTR